MSGYEIALWVQADWALRLLRAYAAMADQWGLEVDPRVTQAKDLLQSWRDSVGSP